MNVSSWRLLPTVLLLLPLLACSVDPRSEDADGADAGPGEAGSGASGGAEGASLGASCEQDADCSQGFSCDVELALITPVRDLPNGVPDLPSAVFPGGSCTPVPAAPYDPAPGGSCDPQLPRTLQGCGEQGICTDLSLGMEPVVACRAACEPSATASGCARTGYTCSFTRHACEEGCQSDEECRLTVVDSDGNGVPDAVAYDAQSRARCDVTTFRCTHDGDGTPVGQACERDDDCDSAGICVPDRQTFAAHPMPGGFCTRLGCDVKGRECEDEGTACVRVRSPQGTLAPTMACMQSCRVGAEPESLRLGPEGHGEGCRPGYRCHYNGGDGAGSGICVGGNYNDVRAPSVGAACERDTGCYSPFGYGNCLSLQVGSIVGATATCSILDCAAPGLPDDICGPEGECVGLSADVSFCVRRCKDASGCAEGLACADDDGLPATPNICYPACFGDEECRKGSERCQLQPGQSMGTCVASAP